MMLYLIIGAFLFGCLVAAMSFWITTIFLIQRQIQRTMRQAAYVASQHALNGAVMAVLAETFVLIAASALVGTVMRNRKDNSTLLILTLYWLAQAAFNVSWVANWPRWQTASWIVCPLCGIAAFLLVGFDLRRKKGVFA